MTELTFFLRKDKFIISADKNKLDIEVIYNFLKKSYWADKRTYDQVKTSIENSLCFGVYEEDSQIGFARLVTDFATFSYLADVFILPDYQGLGLGKWLIQSIFSIYLIKNVRCFLLTTDAYKLYEQAEFVLFPHPERVMIRLEK